MASTGGNKVVSVHTYDSANKDGCWLYGNEQGNSADYRGFAGAETIYAFNGVTGAIKSTDDTEKALILKTQFY